MGYLFIQTWIWLVLAALLGLFIGWLIWRNSSASDCSGLQAQLDECRRRCAELESNAATSRQSADVTPVVSTDPVRLVDDVKPAALAEPEGEATGSRRDY